MATKKNVDELRLVATRIQATPIEKLIRNYDWGSINFDAAKPDLEEIIWPICNELQSLQIELIPEGNLNQIRGPLNEVEATVGRIASFQLGGNDPTAIRDQIVSTLRQQSDQLFAQAHGWIPYLALKRGDVESNIARLQSSVADASQRNSDFQAFLEQKRKEVEKIVSDTREMAGEAGVAQFTTRFADEATSRGKEARFWLGATGAGGLLTIILTVLVFLGKLSPDYSTVTEATRNIILVQSLSTKVILLGILISGTFWCGRQYNVLKHLQTLNRHRADSLRTFQAFTQAANEPAGRDAVLIEATRAIFGHASTGYIRSADSAGDGNMTILEILKQSANGSN